MKVCFKAEDVKQENGYVSCPQIVWNSGCFSDNFYCTNRAGFDGDFAEESYSLVMTGWEDCMDGFLGREKKAGTACTGASGRRRREGDYPGKRTSGVEIEKNPFRICVYDAENTLLMLILWIWLIWKTAITAESIPVKLHRRTASMDSEKRSEEFNKAQKFMNMSPKDAMGYNRKKQILFTSTFLFISS